MISLEHWENLSLPVVELQKYFKDNIPYHQDGERLTVQANAKVFPTKLLELMRSHTQVNMFQSAGKLHFIFYDLSYEDVREDYNGSTKTFFIPTYACCNMTTFWDMLQIISPSRSEWLDQMSYFVNEVIRINGDNENARNPH